MQNTSTVQYIIIAVFIVFIIIGVVIFAGFTGSNNSANGGLAQAKVWGIFPEKDFSDTVNKVNGTVAGTINIQYSQHSLDTFDNDLANAIAQGSGPDLVILPESNLLKNKKLFVVIPYSVIPQRTFQDTFASAGNIFLTNDGITALPFKIDPLVLYWNKDIFATAGIPTPPTLWKDLVGMIPKISNITTGKTILQSAISFGEYANVKNAKEILSMLFLQAGNPIAQYQGGSVISTLDSNYGNAQVSPVQSTLSFYTQFSNPSSAAYTWNRSLPSSDEMFLRGKSATYVGFASEYPDLISRNPNLNFDASIVPQAEGVTNSVTYAEVYGIAIVRSSQNQQSALVNAETMVSPNFMNYYSQDTGMPSVRNDQLSSQSTNAFEEVFRRSILIGKDWMDPDSGATDAGFKSMIESVNNGSLSVQDAVSSFNFMLQELLK